MPLVDARNLMADARAAGYAVGYFESFNLESLQGVVDAAEQVRAPVVLGFNGHFLSRPERVADERLRWYGALGRAAAASASVPCALIFNECPDDDWVRRAPDAGFNLVMPDDPEAPYDDLVARVADLTRFVHGRGAAVEAAIGELASGATGAVGEGAVPTDPEVAARFVDATGIDMLGVSVGNVHVMVEGRRGLDLDRLESVAQRVSLPLVLHGGTGISADALRAAVDMGVAKVNYGTYIKQRYLGAVRAALGSDERDPHRLLGMGGAEDVLVVGRAAVRAAVLERIETLGCCGRA